MRALFESTLLAVARLEAAGVRPPRLTEPDHETWRRFKRKLGPRDLIEFLCEDLAPAFPLPFALDRWGADPAPLAALRALDDATIDALIATAATAPTAPADGWLRGRARALPAGGAFCDLPKMRPRYRVLELPGSAGRIAARLCGQDDTLSLDRQFTRVADTPAERVMVGLATVALRANPPRSSPPPRSTTNSPPAPASTASSASPATPRRGARHSLRRGPPDLSTDLSTDHPEPLES